MTTKTTKTRGFRHQLLIALGFDPRSRWTPADILAEITDLQSRCTRAILAGEAGARERALRPHRRRLSA